MNLKVLRWDDDMFLENGGTINKTEYLKDHRNYGRFEWKSKLDPMSGWAIPIVTGHKYKIHWGDGGIDFEGMTISLSEEWRETDKDVYLVHNWTDVRAAIDVKVRKDGGWETMDNMTIASNAAEYQLGQNIIYNETAIRETHLILTGKNTTENPYNEQYIELTGHRCVGSCVEQVDFNVTTEDRVRYWNNSADWPGGKVPAEGDDVHVEPGWNMVFDMEESPIYKLLRINGNLTFKNTTNTHLRAKHIFIRAGELSIGSPEYPMLHEAKITLYGERKAEAIVYDNAVEAGNKLIANTGKFRAYGKPRAHKMSRLTKEALKGAKSIFVEPGLDWVYGDRIAMMPTSYDMLAVDEFTINTYDNVTGEITFNTTLSYYHWGQATTTADLYHGVDTRGEVLLLTRNVKIRGQDVESWGGQILTGFMMEEDLTMRFGETHLDNVEVYNCSQIDTMNSALRWANNPSGHSSVTNSVIHSGFGWGIKVQASANVLLRNNVVWGFRPIGVAIMSSQNITFDNNAVGHVVHRETFVNIANTVDLEGGVSICSYPGGLGGCKDISVTNNVIGGSVYAALVTHGYDCGDTSQTLMKNNVGHSVQGIQMGHGLIVGTDASRPSTSNCVEASGFVGYKLYYMGAAAFPKTNKIIFSGMTMIDNQYGFGPNMVPGTVGDYGEHVMQLQDNVIIGESLAPDCPQNKQGGYCFKFDKYGLMIGFGAVKGKDNHISGKSALPIHNVHGVATPGARNVYLRNHFRDFYGETKEGTKQSCFDLNPYASDLVPVSEFEDTTFENVADDAWGHFYTPPMAWANVKDCGAFPCTAPLNVLLSFKGTQYTGQRPSFTQPDFQLIANNTGFAPYIPSCVPRKENNLYVCQQTKLGQLIFESEDADNWDRGLHPVYLQLQGTEMNSKLNSFMDHVWDGFYAGQLRLQRFPAVIYAKKGTEYNLTFTGSPAKKFRFELKSHDRYAGTTIRIPYPSAESRKILKDGNVVEMNQWDETASPPGYGAVKQKFCGENRFIGVKNILEFYITPGCVLHIAPRNAIQTMVRMEWTFDEFFSNGGTTTFMDRVAGSLGIHASTIKIVSVYEGSLVVNYAIENDDKSQLENI